MRSSISANKPVDAGYKQLSRSKIQSRIWVKRGSIGGSATSRFLALSKLKGIINHKHPREAVYFQRLERSQTMKQRLLGTSACLLVMAFGTSACGGDGGALPIPAAPIAPTPAPTPTPTPT